MKKLMTVFTRTPLHVGAGNSVGAVDSPIIRERHTGLPIIPGSSLKGVLAALWEGTRKENTEATELFGSDDPKASKAGQLLIGEGKLLAFPVRSAKGAFAFVTSPIILQRLKRDWNVDLEIPQLQEEECWACEDITINDKCVLEEYCLKVKKGAIDIAETLEDLALDDVWQSVATRLVVVSDTMMQFFVQNACEVVTRVKINQETGTAKDGSLFNLEQVPSEALFYSVISTQLDTENTAVAKLEAKITENENILQVGGDAGVGLGFCSIAFCEVK